MRTTAVLGALLLAGALPTITTTTAAAADCSADINDGPGYIFLSDSTAIWDIRDDGAISDGYLISQQRSDAYDGMPALGIDDGTNGREQYDNASDECTYEMGGRQVALPVVTTLGGLEVSRKVYVPASGPGFARFYNQVHNPGTAPVTISVYTADGSAADSGLGSDTDTTIEDSSAGSGVTFVGDELDTAVTWFVTSDNTHSSSSDPVVTHSLDAGSAQVVQDRVDSVVREGGNPGNLSFVYDNVTIPAGGTVAYVLFEALRSDDDGARSIARTIDAAPIALFAGLTDAELAAIQNWNGSDIDADGVANTADSCREVSNPGQADTDHDRIGDACDSDIDGDGIANAVETAFGTNPSAADTDGDGKSDGADNCPKLSGTGTGTGAGGCPATAVPGAVLHERRTSTTTLKVTVTKTGPVVIKTRGKVAGAGTPTARDCTHGLALVVVKVSGLAVSHKLVAVRSDCTFRSKATIRQPRRLVQEIAVVGRFLGTDALLPSRKTVRLG